MKTVASDVPPTGTLSIGTGNASTHVAARSSAASPARSVGEGSSAARADTASTTASVPPKTTGATTGRRRAVSRATGSPRVLSGRVSAVLCVTANSRAFPPDRGPGRFGAPQEPFPSIKPGFPLLSKGNRCTLAIGEHDALPPGAAPRPRAPARGRLGDEQGVLPGRSRGDRLRPHVGG